MFATADLYIIRDSLSQLTETTYFSKRLDKYTVALLEVIEHVLASPGVYPSQVVKQFSNVMWTAYKYLLGSVSKEIPYEMEYSLRFALTDWIGQDCVITTALLDDKDFHFFPFDPWDHIKKVISQFNYTLFNSVLIQVALPRLYKNKPLFNIPLYHELGHFVDSRLNISRYSMLTHTVYPEDMEVELNHRQEYFADIFASCYVGSAVSKILQEIAAGTNASITHPATQSRVDVIQDFLRGTSNPLVDMFQTTLAALTAR